MIKPEQIPDDVVKAALLTDERLGMREVIAAAINAWPTAYTVPRGYPATDVVLPLPKGPEHER